MTTMETQATKVPEGRRLYEEAIRARVCAKCIDFGEDGLCHSADPKGCAVFRFLPELVAIAERLDAPTIQPYVEAVRREICDKCSNRNLEGRCVVREALDCALDRYLPLVLDAIEDEREEKVYEDWCLWRQL